MAATLVMGLVIEKIRKIVSGVIGSSDFTSRTPKDCIPRSRHNPKILGIDDAEIVGDRITEVHPIPRNFFTQETERRIGELGASRVGFIVRDMLVHHAP